MKRLLIPCVLPALLAGCSGRPDGIIPETEMVEIMADLQIAEAYDRNGNPDPDMQGMNRELLGRGILMDHGVTVEEMDSTLAWYGRNMDQYARLYKKVDERLAAMQQKYAKAAGESESDGPSTDLWPYGRHFMVDGNQLTDGLIVNINVPDLEVGDRLTWKMKTHGASSRHLTLGVDYDDGRSEIVDNVFNGMDPWVEASLQTDTLHTVTRIFAVLNIDKTMPRAFVDSVQMLHYPFSREEYHRIGYQRKIGAPARKVKELPKDTVPSLPKDSVGQPEGNSGAAVGKGQERVRMREAT